MIKGYMNYLPQGRGRPHKLAITDEQGRNMSLSARVVSSWYVHRHHPDHRPPITMYQIEAVLGCGNTYTGRCQGEDMVWKGKRKSIQHS